MNSVNITPTFIKENEQSMSWQKLLANGIKEVSELLAILELKKQQLPPYLAQCNTFPLKVPRGYINRMRKSDPHDPLLRQVLPLSQEQQSPLNFNKDPVADLDALRQPGLLQKYHGRVLIVTTGACAIHCRYCFRRHFPYSDSNPSQNHWHEALAYINKNTSIKEVILSGGDPLTLSDDRLTELIHLISTISHVKRLRIHTRLPIVLPQRITDSFLNTIRQTRLKIIMVVHANHANEIDDTVRDAINKLKNNSITLFNQSVLLKGVNDSVMSLSQLSESLFDVGIIPYYLHILDKVEGSAHFDVDIKQAIKLYTKLCEQLPGYLVPKLVQETPQLAYKQPLPFLKQK